MTRSGKVYLIGAGPGDPELMTLRAARMLSEADAVVHDRLVSPEILATAPAGARRVPVGKSPGCHTVPQKRINEILAELAGAGLVVARLKGGDPLIFGRGSEEAAFLMARGIPVEVAPGITAAQGAAAATGIPLTHRGLANGVHFLTGHREKNRPLDLDWKRLANPETTLVVYMGMANIGQIALCLIAEGMPGDLPVLAIANATTPREMRYLTRLDRVAVNMVGWSNGGPVLFLIGQVVSLYAAQETTIPGLAEHLRAAAHA